MIQDRDPGDETDATVRTVAPQRPGSDHITALLGGVGLPSQRILERTLLRQQQAQRQHHQGYTTYTRYAR